MRDLDTKLLRSFVSVVSTGSMTVTAAQTHQTQGAVSQQIRRLEDLLGHTLFHRSKAGLTPTPGGLQLLPHAQNMIAMSETVFAEFRPDVAAAKLRLGVANDLVTRYLSLVLDDFSAAYPDVDIELYCNPSTTLKTMVDGGQLDLAIIEEPLKSAEGDAVRIEPLVWIVKPGGRAQALRPLPVSLVSQSCVFRPTVQAALAQSKISWRAVFDNGDLSATMATVRSGLSLTAGLHSLVPADLLSLAESADLPVLEKFSISLYPAQNKLSGAARNLSQMAQRCMLSTDSVPDAKRP